MLGSCPSTPHGTGRAEEPAGRTATTPSLGLHRSVSDHTFGPVPASSLAGPQPSTPHRRGDGAQGGPTASQGFAAASFPALPAAAAVPGGVHPVQSLVYRQHQEEQRGGMRSILWGGEESLDGSMSAASGGRSRRVEVVCEVELQRHCKRLTLHSTVAFCNRLAFPLELCCHTQGSGADAPAQAQATKVLHPGESFWLPIPVAEAGAVSWRPLTTAVATAATVPLTDDDNLSFSPLYLPCEPLTVQDIRQGCPARSPGSLAATATAAGGDTTQSLSSSSSSSSSSSAAAAAAASSSTVDTSVCGGGEARDGGRACVARTAHERSLFFCLQVLQQSEVTAASSAAYGGAGGDAPGVPGLPGDDAADGYVPGALSCRVPDVDVVSRSKMHASRAEGATAGGVSSPRGRRASAPAATLSRALGAASALLPAAVTYLVCPLPPLVLENLLPVTLEMALVVPGKGLLDSFEQELSIPPGEAIHMHTIGQAHAFCAKVRCDGYKWCGDSFHIPTVHAAGCGKANSGGREGHSREGEEDGGIEGQLEDAASPGGFIPVRLEVEADASHGSLVDDLVLDVEWWGATASCQRHVRVSAGYVLYNATGLPLEAEQVPSTAVTAHHHLGFRSKPAAPTPPARFVLPPPRPVDLDVTTGGGLPVAAAMVPREPDPSMMKGRRERNGLDRHKGTASAGMSSLEWSLGGPRGVPGRAEVRLSPYLRIPRLAPAEAAAVAGESTGAEETVVWEPWRREGQGIAQLLEDFDAGLSVTGASVLQPPVSPGQPGHSASAATGGHSTHLHRSLSDPAGNEAPLDPHEGPWERQWGQPRSGERGPAPPWPIDVLDQPLATSTPANALTTSVSHGREGSGLPVVATGCGSRYGRQYSGVGIAHGMPSIAGAMPPPHAPQPYTQVGGGLGGSGRVAPLGVPGDAELVPVMLGRVTWKEAQAERRRQAAWALSLGGHGGEGGEGKGIRLDLNAVAEGMLATLRRPRGEHNEHDEFRLRVCVATTHPRLPRPNLRPSGGAWGGGASGGGALSAPPPSSLPPSSSPPDGGILVPPMQGQGPSPSAPPPTPDSPLALWSEDFPLVPAGGVGVFQVPFRPLSSTLGSVGAAGRDGAGGGGSGELGGAPWPSGHPYPIPAFHHDPVGGGGGHPSGVGSGVTAASRGKSARAGGHEGGPGAGSTVGVYDFSLVSGLYCEGLVRRVLLLPRFILRNGFDEPICFTQQGTDIYCGLPAGGSCQLHWTDRTRPPLVCLRYDAPGWDWSGSFSPERLGDTIVKMRHHGQHRISLLRVDVSAGGGDAAVGGVNASSNGGAGLGAGADKGGGGKHGRGTSGEAASGGGLGIGGLDLQESSGGGSFHSGTFLVRVSEYQSGFMPYRLDNLSTAMLRYRQKGCAHADDILRPYHSSVYWWDAPFGEHKLVLEALGVGKVGEFALDGALAEPTTVVLKATPQRAELTLRIDVHAEGPTRVLRVADAKVHADESVPLSIPTVGSIPLPGTSKTKGDGDGLRVVPLSSSSASSATSSSSSVLVPSVAVTSTVETVITLRLASLGVSLVASLPSQGGAMTATTSAATGRATSGGNAGFWRLPPATVCRLGGRDVATMSGGGAGGGITMATGAATFGPLQRPPQELLYASLRGLHLRATTSQEQGQLLECHVAALQVDNQLPTAVFPVVLSSGRVSLPDGGEGSPASSTTGSGSDQIGADASSLLAELTRFGDLAVSCERAKVGSAGTGTGGGLGDLSVLDKGLLSRLLADEAGPLGSLGGALFAARGGLGRESALLSSATAAMSEDELAGAVSMKVGRWPKGLSSSVDVYRILSVNLSSLRLEVEEELLLHLLQFSTSASHAILQLSDDDITAASTSADHAATTVGTLASAPSSRHQGMLVAVPASPTVPHRHRDIASLQATPRWPDRAAPLGTAGASSSALAGAGSSSGVNAAAGKLRTAAAASPRMLTQPGAFYPSSPTYASVVAGWREGRRSLDAARRLSMEGSRASDSDAARWMEGAGPVTVDGSRAVSHGVSLGTALGVGEEPAQTDEAENQAEARHSRQAVTDGSDTDLLSAAAESGASFAGGEGMPVAPFGGGGGNKDGGAGDGSQHRMPTTSLSRVGSSSYLAADVSGGASFPLSDFWHTPLLVVGERERRRRGGRDRGGGRDADASAKVYIERLHISAIDVSLSFVSAPWQLLRSHESTAAARSLIQQAGFMLQRRVISLAEMEGAPLHLASINVQHPFGDWDALRGIVVRHYTRQALQGLYMVLGSMDFLGDPVGFYRSIRTGVWDFVAKPAKGILSLRPQDLATDVSEGTSSLVRHTVFALSNGASKMSRAARKGLASMLASDVGATLHSLRSLDERRTRRPTRHTGGHLDALGLDFDLLAWAISVWEDFKTLLYAPRQGLRTGGFAGMANGLWLCGVGAFALPAVVLLEAVAQTMKATCEYVQGAPERPARVRVPRPFWSASMALCQYSAEEAAGWAMLSELGQGLFLSEGYCHCLALAHVGTYVVLTTIHALVVVSVSRNRRPVPATRRDHWELLHVFHLAETLCVARQGRSLAVVALKPPMLVTRHRQRFLPARENVALRRYGYNMEPGVGGKGKRGAARVPGRAAFFPLQFVGMELPTKVGAELLHRILGLRAEERQLNVRRLPFPADELIL